MYTHKHHLHPTSKQLHSLYQSKGKCRDKSHLQQTIGHPGSWYMDHLPHLTMYPLDSWYKPYYHLDNIDQPDKTQTALRKDQ